MDTTSTITLNELRERVAAAHNERRTLRLRGAGTKDFYGEDFRNDAQPRDSIASRAAPADSANHGGKGGRIATSDALDRATNGGHTTTHSAAPIPTETLNLRPYAGIVDYEPSELVITA